ncbi:MAG: hypothetical protein WB678_06670 [Stellaceae bacterium]
MRRWTLAAAAAALFAAALWHLPAVAQRAPAPAAAAADNSAAKPSTPQATAQPVAPDLITFDAYRDFRMRDINERRARLTRELSATDLSAAQKASLERRQAYYNRLAAMPDKERDALFQARFDQIDTDHDGTLDSAERAAWREKQREHYRQLAAERDQKTDTSH